MKQIKTIIHHNPEEFDRDVNQFLKEGWELKERFRADAYTVGCLDYSPRYIAFLEKEVDSNEL